MTARNMVLFAIWSALAAGCTVVIVTVPIPEVRLLAATFELGVVVGFTIAAFKE